MNALTLTLFVSASVIALAILGFLWAFARREHEYADRLRTLPLDDDSPSRSPP
jgi:hypothetical protein